LLFAWLNSLIYLFDVDTLLFMRFELEHFDCRKITAMCRGEKYDQSRHRLKMGVKSSTYHMLEVDEEKN